MALCLRERQGLSTEDIDERDLFTGEMSLGRGHQMSSPALGALHSAFCTAWIVHGCMPVAAFRLRKKLLDLRVRSS